jgi:hypothetical protein
LVQVTYHGGQVVFSRNWARVVYKYDIHYDDVVEFNLQAFALKMIIYKEGCSTTMLYTCPDHS